MTIIAASSIIITAAALFIVLSGFAGLKDFSLQFSSYVDPDLKVLPSSGKSIQLSPSQIQDLEHIEGIALFSKIIEEHVILDFDEKRQLATIKGVDENYTKVTAIDTMITYGNWFENNTNQVVAGGLVAHHLSIGILDYTKQLTIAVPKPGKGQISSVKGAFNTIKAYNVGVFQINEELDSKYLFADINTAKRLLNYNDNQISSLEIKLNANANQEAIKQQLLTLFDHQVIVKNRSQLNDSLNKMLNTENLMVYLIFTLVIIIALFNIVGVLIMMILDKKGASKTLFNLGITVNQVKQIFFLQGSLMTILGGAIGLFLGFVVVFLQQQFQLVMLTPSLPYPVQIKAINFVIVMLTIGVLGILASKVASARVKKGLITE